MTTTTARPGCPEGHRICYSPIAYDIASPQARALVCDKHLAPAVARLAAAGSPVTVIETKVRR